MNLTSKRVFQLLPAFVCAAALTASAQTTWVSDNFEPEGVGSTNAAIGSAAGFYKSHIWGGGNDNNYTNEAWTIVPGDASTIQAGGGDYMGGVDTPIPLDAKTQVLKLETEGQTLSRYIAYTQDNGQTHGDQEGIPIKTPAWLDFGQTPVWVDTLMKFTPSEDEPIIGNDVKLGLYVNANSNLVLRHKYYEAAPAEDFVPISSVFTSIGTIDPERWYRITIQLGVDTFFETPEFQGANLQQFQIWWDGTLLSHANGMYDYNSELLPNGSIFFTLSLDDFPRIKEVAFQGTGYVDELVVTDVPIVFGAPSSILLTLAYDSSLLTVLSGGNSVSSNGTVVSGAALAITAKDFYRVTDVDGTDVTFTPTTGAIGDKEVIGTVSGVTATEVTITATMIEDNATTSIMGQSVSAGKLADWAGRNGNLTEAYLTANAATLLDDYLFNVAPGDNPTLKITGIETGVSTATITVSATTALGAAIDLDKDNINGELWVYTTDDLAEGFTAPPSITAFTVTTDTDATVVVPFALGNFIKAVVK